MTDIDLIRAELRALSDHALFARAVEAIRVAHAGRVNPSQPCSVGGRRGGGAVARGDTDGDTYGRDAG